MTTISISQLSKLAGVSLRTLRHYDEIGLLKPQLRRASGYRYYGKAEVLRLQQILFYKELGLPLAQIQAVLAAPDFDLIAALEAHKAVLKVRQVQTAALLETLEKTLNHLKGGDANMQYEDLYKGFSREAAEAYEAEAKDRWGVEAVEASKQRVMKAGKQKWDEVQQKADTIYQALAAAMETLQPHEAPVQALVQDHFDMTGHFYTVTPEIYRGLAALYVEDARFTAYYENYRQGLAKYLSEAMLYFCEKNRF